MTSDQPKNVNEKMSVLTTNRVMRNGEQH